MSTITQGGVQSTKLFDTSVALDSAARECRHTLSELLQDGALHQRRIRDFDLTPFRDKKIVSFEVGFGSPGLRFLESAVSIESVIELCRGGTLRDVPLKIPHAVSTIPLSTAVAESFPVLLRGIIAIDDLVPCSDDFSAASLRSAASYREVRGSLNALNVRDITICRPEISPASEYFYAVQNQWESNVAKLREALHIG